MPRALVSIAVAALVSGCRGDGDQPQFPGLHPVVGTVSRGGSPVSGGAVQFVPEPDRPEFLINSEVGPDGRFSLSTVRTTDSRGERRPGAPPGNYRVTYLPPVADQTTGNLEPITLPKPLTVESQSNDLLIDLPPRPGR